MLSLSRTTGYAVHALCCVEMGHGEPRFVRDIARATGIKKPYLAKIINQLVHHKLVVAKRGYCGGVVLARPAEQITLIEIVLAIEGERWTHACLFGLDHCCASRICPAHARWQAMRTEVEALLRATTLADTLAAICPKEQPAVTRRVPWPIENEPIFRSLSAITGGLGAVRSVAVSPAV